VSLVAATVQGFQSYRDPQTVEFDERLTLIVGLNDVGKSALLRVLRLWVAVQEGGHEDFALRLTWRPPGEELRTQLERSPESVREWLTRRPITTFSLTYWPNGPLPDRFEHGSLSLVRIELPEVDGLLVAEPGHAPGWVRGPADAVANNSAAGGEIFINLGQMLASNVAYVGPRVLPTGFRQLRASSVLQPDGANLADVLNKLISERNPTFDAVQEFIQRAFPQIHRIGVKLNDNAEPIQGVPAIYYRHAPQRSVLLEHAGTGIAQLLTLATGVLTNADPRLFLIDEPQAFLHPQAERDLLALLEEHEEHQYVIATHSHFLLSATPLTQARLLRVEEGATRVFAPSRDDLLAELGITAADLWLADRVLWVEGPSEVSMFELLLDRVPESRPRATWIKPMPVAASLFTRRNDEDMAFRFVNEVVEATRGSGLKMRFLFDRDERTDEQRERLRMASGNRADFLERRELENYLLDPDLIFESLSAVRAEHDARGQLKDEIGPLDIERMRETLNDHLQQLGDPKLFPAGLRDGRAPIEDVKGSEVLDRLWWDFARGRYDKARDGAALAALTNQRKPELLDPLADILRHLAGQGGGG
jgi:predicted ATPase